MKTFDLQLSNSYMLTPKVKHFVFESKHKFEYIPGQFITVHLAHKNKIIKRSYSIANTHNTNTIEIAASYVENGPGSEYLFNLKPKETITSSGPFGRLILRDERPKRYFFIGTSTGITPYRSMLVQLEKKLSQGDIDIFILQGVTSQEHLLYTQDFQNISEKYSNFHFSAHYSKKIHNDSKPYEYKGYVQEYIKNHIHLNPTSDIVYLCGNPNMVNDIFTYTKSMNFDTKQIRREKYIST